MGAIQERTSKSGNKTYRVQIRIKGEKPISNSFKRKTDAKNWMLRTEAAIREGRYFSNAESKKHTLGDLIDRYSRDYLKHQKSKQTPKQTLGWWEERIGHLSLDQIKTPIIKEHWDILANTPSKRTGKLLSNRTLNSYLETLSAMLTVAVREYGWIQHNPITNLRKKKLNNQRTRVLSEKELEAFFEAVRADKNTYLLPAVMLSLSTGGRKTEIMSLKWSDINLKEKRVTFRETKNGDTRSVTLSSDAILAIQEHGKVRKIDCEYVFPNRRPRWKAGEAQNPKPWEDITSAFRRARSKAKLKDFRWHDLRHCVASYLLASGATLGEVGKILGHRSPSMTWRYSHMIQSKADELINKMADNFLKDCANG